MDAPADTPEPASSDGPTAAEPKATPQPSPKDTAPSGIRLVLTSLAAFTGVVMLGGVIGLILGRPSVNVAPSTLTVASVRVAEATAAVPATAAPVTTTPAAPPTTLVQADEPVETQVLDVVERAPIVEPQPSQGVGDEIPEDLTLAEPENASLGNRSLALAQPVEVADTEFLELPKAVFDRFSLRRGDSFAINVASNDKIGGILQSVELTGLGELAPGFALDADGTLSGTAIVCGDWSAQYALNSTNPAVGTSWIEITVVGCNGA